MNVPIGGDINPRSLYEWTTMTYDSTPSVKLHIRAYDIILNVRTCSMRQTIGYRQTFCRQWLRLARRVLSDMYTSWEFAF